MVQNRDLCLPHLYSTGNERRVRRVPVGILPRSLVRKMVWLPDGEKNFDDIIIRFDRIHERDRQTDRQTDETAHDGIGRCSRRSTTHRNSQTAVVKF